MGGCLVFGGGLGTPLRLAIRSLVWSKQPSIIVLSAASSFRRIGGGGCCDGSLWSIALWFGGGERLRFDCFRSTDFLLLGASLRVGWDIPLGIAFVFASVSRIRCGGGRGGDRGRGRGGGGFWMDLVASVEFISAAGMRRTRATTANGYGILIQ